MDIQKTNDWHFFIDSFTVYTPIKSYRYVNSDLLEKCIVVRESTMEVVDEEIRLPIYVNTVDGIKFRVSVVSLFGEEFTRITFTSKMLKEKYFEGLNWYNFNAVFDFVMRKIDCEINWFDFIQDSKITDVDFAVDFIKTDEDFQNAVIKNFGNVPTARRYYAGGENYTDKRRFVGLQIVNRKDASIGNPFVKFYTKLDELETRSNEFYKYLLSKNIRVLSEHRRLEVTAKNRKHLESIFRSVGLCHSKISVSGILLLSRTAISDIIFCVLSRYRDHFDDADTIEGVTLSKLTPSAFMMGAMCSKLLDEGYRLREIVSFMEERPNTSSNAKSRIKHRIIDSVRKYRHAFNLSELVVTANDAYLVPDKNIDYSYLG